MSNSSKPDFPSVRERLEQDDAPDLLIRQFEYAYDRLYASETTWIRDADIRPIPALPTWAELERHEAAGEKALAQTVMIKLNGGLGTSMGLNRAKSLLTVKASDCFLDIIAKQILHIRKSADTATPLIFMNSFSTREDTATVLERYPDVQEGQGEIPIDFLQHRVPKLLEATGAPADHPDQPDLAWCPPGHGDIYVCLQTTGLLQQLLDAGFRYAFVSNADNLGAVLDRRILGFMVDEQTPFIMEATRRTAADRKGGHLAQQPDGGYLLRESAQCPPEEKDSFQDIDRYRFFNTNNLWIDLDALAQHLEATDGIMTLPVLVNRKTLDPRDPDSPAVIQLETAMGSALASIPGALAVDVPRTRFAPVKTTDDLLALRSDRFALDERSHVVPTVADEAPIDIQLDPAHYKLIDAFEARFQAGIPSLKACRRLVVEGDVYFGADVRCEGEVHLVNPHAQAARIEPDRVLSGRHELSCAPSSPESADR